MRVWWELPDHTSMASGFELPGVSDRIRTVADTGNTGMILPAQDL